MLFLGKVIVPSFAKKGNFFQRKSELLLYLAITFSRARSLIALGRDHCHKMTFVPQ